MRKLVLIGLCLTVLTACGSSGTQDKETSSPTVVDAPENLSVIREDTLYTITWSEVNGATSYTLIYAEEPFTETGSDLAGMHRLTNVFPGHSLIILNKEPLYHFVVKANIGDFESEASEQVIVAPRYELSGANNEFVLDHVNHLEWFRCYYGQTWDSELDQCTGSPLRLNYLGARSAASSMGMRVPTKYELTSLLYCKYNKPIYFPNKAIEEEIYDGPCSEGYIYTDIFSEQRFSVSLIVSNQCVYNSQIGQSVVDSSYYSDGFCLMAMEAVSVHLRPVRHL